MSLKHEVTFVCDGCELNHLLDEDTMMDLPPGWFGMQVVVADSDGCVPEHEREVFCHFCSQLCLMEYSSSNDMRERLIFADKPKEEDEES